MRVRLPGAAGKPAGVYAAAHSIRVRYGSGSHFGVYLLTVWGSRYGVGPRAIRARASTCRACTHNRLITLAAGVPAAVAAGGGHPSTVTWREGGRTFEVRGPAGDVLEPRRGRGRPGRRPRERVGGFPDQSGRLCP